MERRETSSVAKLCLDYQLSTTSFSVGFLLTMTMCCTIDVELDMCNTIISENVIDFSANASWTMHSTYHTVLANLTPNGAYMRHFSVSFTVAYITLPYSVQYSYMAMIMKALLFIFVCVLQPPMKLGAQRNQ